MLTIPYVTAAEFRAHPTNLDLQNLRSGDSNPADQVDELTNILLMASREADNFCQMGEPDGTLAAHVKTEHRVLRLDRYHRLHFHPAHIPILWVSSVSYGWDYQRMQSLPNPVVWIEDERNVTVDLRHHLGGVHHSISYPARLGQDGKLFTEWTYTAGYVNTLLAADAAQGATSIVVQDPTGVTGGVGITPATVLRLWEPGYEESVTVSPDYLTGSTTVPLTSGLRFTHTITKPPVGVSSLPADVHLAIIQWATALLMRPNSKSTSQWKGSAMRLSTAGKDDAWGDASGLVKAGRAILQPYRRIR